MAKPSSSPCFDLGDDEITASAHAVKVTSGARFRNVEMSIDDVLELRELTALTDELDDLLQYAGLKHASSCAPRA